MELSKVASCFITIITLFKMPGSLLTLSHVTAIEGLFIMLALSKVPSHTMYAKVIKQIGMSCTM
jgi:hypothetical protein